PPQAAGRPQDGEPRAPRADRQAGEGPQATDQRRVVTEVATDAAEKLYYRIGEVESLTSVPAYVLRYWESEFKLLRPKKNPAGQRVYRQRDLDLVRRIKTLLYDERLTLEGAKK